jgi:hypothetical protein
MNPPAPQDRCGDRKLVSIHGEGHFCNLGRARLENAREWDRCSAPERYVVRSTTAARPSMRRDSVLRHLDQARHWRRAAPARWCLHD